MGRCVGKSILPGVLFVSLFLITATFQVLAQHSGHAPGGSYGPAVNITTLPAPPLMTGIGTSHIPITTSSPQAQKYFDQGVNLLHCFWDVEAYRAFKEASRLDPAAPMPYWGIFSALGQNSSEMAIERTAAINKALELMPETSDREKYYIRAISALADRGKGRPAWAKEMEALVDKYPEEIEAKIFLAYALVSPSLGRSQEGRSMLKGLLSSHPEHAAVHHYWIHSQEDGPRPQDAIPSAEKLPKLVPNSGHMLHMPGHIYYKLGEYEKARKHFVDSVTFDLAYMKAQNMNPINNWNFVHNLDYLVANCAEEGRYEEAIRYAKMLGELQPDETRLNASGLSYIVWGGHTSLMKLQMRYGAWDDAIRDISARLGDKAPTTLPQKYQATLLYYLRGMSAIDKGNTDEAAKQLEALDSASDELGGVRTVQGSDWYFSSANKTVPVHIQDLKGSLQSALGRHDEAIKLLLDTVERERNLGYWEPPHYTRPALESLALAYLKAGKYSKAIGAYEDLLKLRPNSGFAYLGMARVYVKEGNRKKAADRYRQFLGAWANADKNLPQVAEASEYMKQNK